MTDRKTAAMRQRRPKGEGSIRERPDRQPDKRWEGRVTIPETQERISFYAPTYDAVHAKMREFWVEHKRKKAPRVLRKLTVAEYLERWMATTARARFDAKVWNTQCSLFRNHVLPALGQVELAKLTPDQVQSFLLSRLEPCGPKGRPLAPRTIQHLRWIFSGALRDALKQGLLDQNPAHGIENPQVERHRPVFLNTEQGQALLAALPTHPLGTLYAVALGAGLRHGEVLGICWQDLDLATGDLVLSHQLKRFPGKWSLAQTKDDSVRTVTLPPFALELVKTHQLRQQEADRQQPPPKEWRALVFRTPAGYPYHQEGVVRKLGKFALSLGLPKIVCHELRHTSASLMMASGANLKEVQELLGHKHSSITAEYYAHLQAGQARRNAAYLSAILTPPVP